MCMSAAEIFNVSVLQRRFVSVVVLVCGNKWGSAMRYVAKDEERLEVKGRDSVS